MTDVINLEPSHVISEAIDTSIERHIDRSIGDSIDRIVSEQLEKSLAIKVDRLVNQKLDAEIKARIEHPKRANKYEQFFEDKLIFGSRWVLAPAYSFLVFVLLVLLVQCFLELVQLVRDFRPFNEGATMIQALTVIDVVLVMNLLLMVLLVGYTNFVSKIHPARNEDWPEWTRELDYSGLKLQMLGSVIAISAIVLLRELIAASQNDASVTRQGVAISIALHLTFVVSAIVVAVVNKMHVKRNEKERAKIA